MSLPVYEGREQLQKKGWNEASVSFLHQHLVHFTLCLFHEAESSPKAAGSRQDCSLLLLQEQGLQEQGLHGNSAAPELSALTVSQENSDSSHRGISPRPLHTQQPLQAQSHL